MPSPECKVYFDGSHYIAIPHTTRPYRPRRKRNEEKITVKQSTASDEGSEKGDTMSETSPSEIQKGDTMSEDGGAEPSEALTPIERIAKARESGTEVEKKQPEGRVMTKRELFEETYKACLFMKAKERRTRLIETMLPYFKTREAAENYVQYHWERKKRNLLMRRIRLTRKANLQTFNYFVTLTYNGKLHTEASFKKKLKTCLRNFCNRKGWKYIGVWERSPEKQRLHFHGIFYIPEGTMPGLLFETKDYNFKSHRRIKTVQNSYFNERFGRSDFEKIEDHNRIGDALAYLMKYIEKSGEKIVYSKGLPQFFISDIMDEDVVCPFGLEDKKLLLFDDFACFDEGEYIGVVGKETIERLRKAN